MEVQILAFLFRVLCGPECFPHKVYVAGPPGFGFIRIRRHGVVW